MSKARAKGTRAATAVARYLSEPGYFPYAEKRALVGALDRGDITGLPDTCIEVKSRQHLDYPLWIRETEREMHNDQARWGLCWCKLPGTTDPGRWSVLIPREVETVLADDGVIVVEHALPTGHVRHSDLRALDELPVVPPPRVHAYRLAKRKGNPPPPLMTNGRSARELLAIAHYLGSMPH